MDNDNVFSAFLHGLEDEIDGVDPAVDFGSETATPARVHAGTSATDQTTEEPLTYLSGIMSATVKTNNASRVLLDDGDLFLLN